MQLAERHWPGDPQRPALALHCSMGSSGYWGPVAERLGDLVALTAVDAPGHGASPDWQPGDVDFHSAFTRAVAARIDRPLDLIGHSLGATVALRIAVGAPHAIRSLTLVEPVLFAAAGSTDPLFAVMEDLLAQGRDEDATRAFLGGWGSSDFDALPAAIRARMVRQIRLVHQTNDILVHDRAGILREDGLEGIDAPVMLIRGAESPPVIAAITDALAARLPDVARAVVPEAGHMLPLTHPQAVGDLIHLNLERA